MPVSSSSDGIFDTMALFSFSLSASLEVACGMCTGLRPLHSGIRHEHTAEISTVDTDLISTLDTAQLISTLDTAQLTSTVDTALTSTVVEDCKRYNMWLFGELLTTKYMYKITSQYTCITCIHIALLHIVVGKQCFPNRVL